MKKPNITFEEMLELVKDHEDPVRWYTYWLLAETWRNNEHFRVFMPDSPLPVPDEWTAEDVPPYERIRNRLKVILGLDPVIYPEPKSGTVELVIGFIEVHYNITFIDTEPIPRFEVKTKEIGEVKIECE